MNGRTSGNYCGLCYGSTGHGQAKAYTAVNAITGNAAQHAYGFLGAFKAQAITNNRIARHSLVGQALEHDAVINAFATKGLDGKTAGLAYAWRIDVGALADNPAGAVNHNYNDHAALGGAHINYNLRNPADVANLARAKAKLEDPTADDT